MTMIGFAARPGRVVVSTGSMTRYGSSFIAKASVRSALKAWKWRDYAASYDLTVNRLIFMFNHREASVG